MPNRPSAPSIDELVRLFVQASEPQRVTKQSTPQPTNAAPVIMVFGGRNVIAPAPQPRPRKARPGP